MNLPWLKLKGIVKGIWNGSAPYRPLLEDGDSSPYFGTYAPQRFGGYETSTCWDVSGCNVAETKLQILWKLNLIPQDTKDWCIANRYCDENGLFDLSEMWVAILSGAKNNGNNQLNFWKIVSVSGLIPHSMLSYSDADAWKNNSMASFVNDYFNVNRITSEMIAMGKEFLKRFSIQAENVQGGFMNDIATTLQTYLKEGSMQIGHPVPQDGSWNKQFVDYPVGRLQADHATEIYKFDRSQAYPFFDYDSYRPERKQLSANYFIPFLTRVTITPLQVSTPTTLPQFNFWMKFWFAVKAYLNKQPNPFPDVQVGKVV